MIASTTAVVTDTASVDEVAEATARRRLRWPGLVTWLAIMATVLQFLPRIWGQWGGWFYADDFWGQDLVVGSAPFEGLWFSAGGHLAPLNALIGTELSRATLFNWPAHVAMTVVWWILCDLLILLAVRQIWGWGWPSSLTYAAFCLSTFTVPSFLWAGQVGLGAFTVIGLGLVLVGVLRAVRVPSRMRVLTSWGALVLALSLSERAALEAAFVGLFALVVFAGDAGGIGRFLRRNLALYLGSGVILAGYAVVYVRAVRTTAGDALLAVRPTLDGLGANILEGLGQSIVPTVFGGPWFLDSSPVVARAEVPVLVVLGAIELVVIVLAALVVRRRAAVPVIVLLLVIVAANLVLISVARASAGGAYAMRDWRYFVSLGVWVPFLLMCAFVPPGNPTTGPWPARLPAAFVRSVRAQPIAWALIGLVLVNASLVTTYLTAARFRDNPARPFLERTLADLERLGPVTIIDRQLPAGVIPPILTTQTRASRVLSAATPTPLFDVPTDSLFAIDDSGAVVPAGVLDGPVIVGGLDGPCGSAVQPGTEVRVRLGQKLIDWSWWARVDYLAQDDSVLTVDSLGVSTDVPVRRGAGVVFVPLTGPVDAIDFSVAPGDGGVCVGRLQVGNGGALPKAPAP